jgi:biotin carboxyl carrier protein
MQAVSKGGASGSSILRHLWYAALAAVLLSAQAQAAVQIEGRFTQGGMAIGSVEPGARVNRDGQPVPVAEDGTFVLGFARDAKPKVRLEVLHADGRKERRTLQIARREFRIQRIDGLPSRKVTPRSKEDIARIRREAAAVRKARSVSRELTDFREKFIWPVTGPISGVYGSQRILNGKPRRPHMGVDIARPAGTTVVAPADGVVILAEPDLFFSGGTLLIDHGMRVNTSYLHLSRLLVKEGQHVKQGQPIAEIGQTGRATGPHLHWGANVRDVRIDPQLLVPPMPKTAAK